MPSKLTYEGKELYTFDVHKKPNSFYVGSLRIRYTPNMLDVDSNTKIMSNNYHKTVTNIAVWPQNMGFGLMLFHALKISDNHVDEADIVAKWHFDTLDFLENIIKEVTDSLDKYKDQSNS